MPFPLALALLLGAGASAGASVYGAKSAAGSARRAGDIQAKSDADALAFERMRFDDERKFRDAQAALDARRWQDQFDFERRVYDAREARLAPYREAGVTALGRLPDLLGPQGQMAWRSPSNAGRVTLGDLARRN